MVWNDFILAKILCNTTSKWLPEDREPQNYEITMRKKREREKSISVPDSHMFPTTLTLPQSIVAEQEKLWEIHSVGHEEEDWEQAEARKINSALNMKTLEEKVTKNIRLWNMWKGSKVVNSYRDKYPNKSQACDLEGQALFNETIWFKRTSAI